MNTKNKLVKRLLKIAKKHKILTYPVLAMVAIISFVGNLFAWRNGAGKRVVAVIMVMVMFISQSYFLTSSATALVDTKEESLIQQELQQATMEEVQEENVEEAIGEEQVSETNVSTDTVSDTNVAEEVIENEEVIINDGAAAVYVEENEFEDDTVFWTDETEDIEKEEQLNSKLDVESSTIKCKFNYPAGSGNSTSMQFLGEVEVTSSTKNEQGRYVYDVTQECSNASTTLNASNYGGDCYNYSVTWYYDRACNSPVDTLEAIANSQEQGNDVIQLYCTRVIKKYKVYIDENIGDSVSRPVFSPEADGVSAEGVAYYYVDAQGDGDDKTGSLTLNISRFGYKISNPDGCSLNGMDITTGTEILGFSGNKADQYVTLKWQPDTYRITYADTDGNSVSSQDATYDGEETFKPLAGIAETPEGCKNGKWRIGEGGSVVSPGESIAAYQDEIYMQEGIKLYPVFEYDDNLILNQVQSPAILHTYQYKVEESVPITILAKYEHSSSDVFGSNYFNYSVDGAQQFEALGIQVTAGSNGVILKTIEDGPIKITDNRPAELTIHVSDSNPKNTAHVEYTFVVAIEIEPCIVTAVASSENGIVKTFNGKVGSELSTDNARKIPSDALCEGQMVYVAFDSAEYASPEVGNNIAIRLNNPRLEFAAGISDDVKSNYLLKRDADGNVVVYGSIEPRMVYIKTYADMSNPLYNHSNGGQYVRAGDPEPEFKFSVDSSRNSNNVGLVDGYELNPDNIHLFSTRSDLFAEGQYTIDAEIEGESNYEVVLNDRDKTPYRVIRETPDYRYEFTSEPIDDWYGGQAAQIRPTSDSGYDTIHISKDGRTDLEAGGIVSITEEDFPKNSLVYLKLSSETGAETSWMSIRVNVDTTAPSFVHYEILSDGTKIDGNVEGALYFPTEGMTSFGSYFNQTVIAVVKYKDVTSGPKNLYYGLFGEAPDMSRPVLFNNDLDADGYRTATFEIAKGLIETVGTITVKAQDAAGNMSDETVLSRNGIDQWSVETGKPYIDEFVVTSGTKDNEVVYVVNNSMEYYTNCVASIRVLDQTSGIRNITWHVADINGVVTDETVPVSDISKSVKEYTFKKSFPSSGKYTVSATVTDNAGNVVDTPYSITFMVDNEPPEVRIITDDYNAWKSEVKLEFTAFDELSGIKYINVTDAEGNLFLHKVEAEEAGVRYCSFVTDKKGVYKIVVEDYAGNRNTDESLIIRLENVSSEVPECPTIHLEPDTPDSMNDWYKTVPTVTIGNVKRTMDGTPVTSKYQLSKEGETPYNETSVSPLVDSQTVEWTGDGVYNLKIWSESQTGVFCSGNHTSAQLDKHDIQIKVDTKKPIITFTPQSDGSILTVNFKIVDDTTDTPYVSGIDADSIMIFHDGKSIVAQMEEGEDGYIGSFDITETGSYSIEASDLAGNIAVAAAFTPMSMKVRAVTNISSQAATVGAHIIKGSSEIESAVLAYRELSEEEYVEAEVISSVDAMGNVNVSSILDELKENTAYAFKVIATSEIGEVLEYEGYFKTLSTSAIGTYVTGTARYSDEVEDGMITVGLFERNICVMAVEINAGDNFTFSNVPDGNYSIVATDGKYSKTKRVLIKDGMIVYPESMIELVLSGRNTSVVIVTDETPNITADNLDSIFNDDIENFTIQDRDLIESDGTVEFKLYATLMNVSNVKPEEISAMYAETNRNKIPGKYLDLSLYKITTDSDGKVHKTQIHQLTERAYVSVTIPLGELADKPGLVVVRIHDNGDRFVGSTLQDMDTNPSTYTISTSQFSTYAILYDPPVSTESNSSDATTENQIAEGTMNPAENGAVNVGTNSIIDPGKDDVDDKNTTEKKPTKKQSNSKKDKVGLNTSVGTLKSSGSAKTGDSTPVGIILILMMSGLFGFVALHKKRY